MNAHTKRAYLILLLLPAMAGCSMLDRQYVRSMGAAEIKTEFTINQKSYSVATILASSSNDATSDVMSAWLGAAAADSISKCNEFLARLSVQQTSWDTSLDIVALATGGAAAVAVLPATTAAALAAGSTFATGTRALIDSDVYGKVGATLIVSEIRQDYFPQITKDLNSITSVSGKAGFISQYGNLLQDHGLCSLQAALFNLSNKSAGVTSKPPIIPGINLQANQTYRLASGSGVEVTLLSTDGQNFTLKGYAGDPVVNRAVAAAVLNGEKAILEK